VYEVLNLHLKRFEALKVLSESMEGDAAERFAHEAKIAASLNHPRIVKIHAFGLTDGISWYSMDLIDGPSLSHLLASQGVLDESNVLRAMIPILDALDYSHGQGIIHRDIKPGNILVNSEGRPFLTDFGIAKSPLSPVKTRTGLLMGTPAYIAPEQARMAAADPRSDIYAVGAMMYHLLTGHLPFLGETAIQMVVARLDHDPTPIRDVRPSIPQILARIIETAMNRDPGQRFDSPGDMRDALRICCQELGIRGDGPITGFPLPPCQRTGLPAWLDSEGNSTGNDSIPTEKLRRPGWFQPWHLGVGLAAFVALAGFGFLWRQAPRNKPQTTLLAKPVATVGGNATVPEPNPHVNKSVKRGATSEAPPPIQPPRRPVTYPQLEQSYPPELPATGGCEGKRAILSVLVGEDGRVRSCKVISDTPTACAESARNAVLKYLFKPALDSEGLPVAVVSTISVEFQESK
jgi:serine/threonine-protein kinase